MWLERVLAHFPHLVWLNPTPLRDWGWTPSIGIVRQLLDERMYPLTLDGITQAMTALRQSRPAKTPTIPRPA